ncbi:MAG: N-acetylglucosamine kinase [Pirellulales bacterium]|nr:N-acetylglucosamine kinase [Pirellulales bacterium]
MEDRGDASSQLVLGVDGGGTKTVCWIASLERATSILGRGRSGASNPRAVGLAAACDAIDGAIAKAFDDASLDRRPVAASTFGLAGAGPAEIQDAIAAWAHGQRIAEHVCVVPDFELVLAAVAPDGVGVGLIAGTGSLAFGRNARGETARAGGWGYLLGDEGSGFAIGRAAVCEMIERLESAGRAGESGHEQLLEQLVLGHFDAADTAQLVRAIYAADDPRFAIAHIARLVVQAAVRGDPSARGIVQKTADDLARLVHRLAQRLGFDQGEFPLAVAGGVLTGSDTIRAALRESLRERDLVARIEIVHEPVVGAIALAAQSACRK